MRSRSDTRRWIATRATSLTLGAGLGLGSLLGCGVPERVVGLRPAPTEQIGGAPFTQASAQSIATRVLAAAGLAFAAPDGRNDDRGEVLSGPALRLAQVSNRFTTREASLTPRTAPQVLAISTGRAWPRRILATTVVDDIQSLHVLIADSPTAPYKLWVSAPMLPGASIPALPPVSDGISTITTDAGLVASPARVLTAYCRLLDVPRTLKRSSYVTDDDAYAVALLRASAAQKKALGSLGTFTRTHRVVPDESVAFQLADGSALAFGQFTRTDQLAPTSKAKRLDLPADLAKLAGRKTVTDRLRLRWLMTTIMVIPADQPARVVGVGEQLRGISAK